MKPTENDVNQADFIMNPTAPMRATATMEPTCEMRARNGVELFEYMRANEIMKTKLVVRAFSRM